MNFLGDDDIAGLLDQIGEAVSIGASSTKGLVDYTSEEEFPGEVAPVIGKAVVVTIKTGSLAGLAAGATFLIGATSYRVRQFLQIEDGALTKVILNSA